MAQPVSQSIFVSYSRDDEQFVLRLADQLRALGMNAWVDQCDIPKGVDWDRAIEDALAHCACLLIILSPNSVASDEVRSELRTAIDIGKPIVPVLLKACGIPRRLRLIQHVDISALPNAPENAERIVEALKEALSSKQISDDHESGSNEESEGWQIRRGLFGREKKHGGGAMAGDITTFVGKFRQWGRERPSYLLALSTPYLAFATWYLFRLPVWAEGLPVIVFGVTVITCLFVIWLGSRLGASLLAASIGGAFVLKPLLIPFEGFVGGLNFPYSSATSMNYWVPGAAFLACSAALILFSTRSRLAKDFRRLRPTMGAIAIGAIFSLPAYYRFSKPSLYALYEPFRPRYRQLREHLKSIAITLDAVQPPVSKSLPVDLPVVLDQSSRVRNEDGSTTGHILIYQHLTEPDAYFGDIEYAFHDDLHLHIRDTGPNPVLYAAGFAKSPNDSESQSLERALNAPYLVVVKPLSLHRSGRVDNSDIANSGPYRVFLYHLKRDEVLWAADLASPVTNREELQEGVYSLLERSVGAKILR